MWPMEAARSFEREREWARDQDVGGNDFFEVTKAFHNALQGSSYKLTKGAQETFLLYNEQNRDRIPSDGGAGSAAWRARAYQRGSRG